MLKKFLLQILLIAFSCSVQAREIAGVHINETVAVPGVTETLKLNGAAIRSKFFIKVYVAALYINEPSSNPETVLASTSAKRMMMHMLYSEVEKEKMISAWREGFEKNLGTTEFAAIKPRLDRFNNLFTTMHKNDVALIDYIPGVGTRVTIRGEEKEIIEGADFYRAVLSVWIGDNPATEDLKTGLLGVDK